jgi:superfamily II DNA/RNA helicase
MESKGLENYGVSRTVIDRLEELGFGELTEIQKLAIEKGLFDGKSLIVSAPTNTGKTFICLFGFS